MLHMEWCLEGFTTALQEDEYEYDWFKGLSEF